MLEQPSPEGYYEMNCEEDWTVYRTRFLVRARRLTERMVFIDALGREHTGDPGDYLVESAEGCFRITARKIFEDVYVPLAESPPVADLKASTVAAPLGPSMGRERPRSYAYRETANIAPCGA